MPMIYTDEQLINRVETKAAGFEGWKQGVYLVAVRSSDDIPDAFFVNYAMGAAVASTADFNRQSELTLAATINSDKNFGEVAATAPLPPLPNSAAATTVGQCVSDTWYCTTWNACSPDGAQTRFCSKIQDCPAVDTPMPPVTQSCTPPAETACTADMWYCQEWNACSPSGTQTRF